MAEPPSSPPSGDATAEDALAWYKSQYEQLEQELIEFRESSRELEGELERDLDAADKRERKLREKAEALDFEVEEWKRKYKESKSEASAAQTTLEKEITQLRDTNRTLQLKLRDIEVANDDFERQARNTTSSLEDLESKYNVAIERGVLLEEEIKMGEQERETLRVDAQRLREELSDLKIEVDVLQNKIKKQEERHLSTISTDISVPESPTFDHSPISTASSPLITTPPDSKSLADSVSDVQEPPSPPMSDASAPMRKPHLMMTPAPGPRKSRLPSAERSSITPRPKALTSSVSSATSRPLGTRAATTSAARTPAPRTTKTVVPRATSHKLPSTSLSHIRSLTAQMQRLEARVHSARSKLPAPVSTPPRASPRSSLMGPGGVPSTVTVRSRKRTSGSAASSVMGEEATPTPALHSQPRTVGGGKHVPRLSTSGVSRLSFGPLPNRTAGFDSDSSRPNSRASVTSYARPGSRSDLRDARDMPPPRPMSRTSVSGARTPLGRPRSSMSGSVHGHGMSISGLPEDEVAPPESSDFRTSSRRGTYSKYDMDAMLNSSVSSTSSIPAPSGIPMPSGVRRQSGGPPPVGVPPRRTSMSTK